MGEPSLVSFVEGWTWSQLYRRTLNVAHEVGRHGSVGDRAVSGKIRRAARVKQYQHRQFIQLGARARRLSRD